MALLELDHYIMKGIRLAGYSHIICTTLNEKEASAVDQETEGELLKFIPVKSANEVSATENIFLGSYTINLLEAENEINKMYSSEMGVRFFIEGRFAS